LQGALREVKEEVGVDLLPEKGHVILSDIKKIEFGKVVNKIVDVWLFEYDGEVDLSNATTDEVAQVAWMNRSQIKELFDANMFVCGCIFKRRAPKKINCIFGYRTSTSMINKETWEYAHACFGKVWYMCGGVFFLISMVAMICCYILNKEMIEIISIILIVVHCIAIFASIFAVERKLKRNFDKEGKRI